MISGRSLAELSRGIPRYPRRKRAGHHRLRSRPPGRMETIQQDTPTTYANPGKGVSGESTNHY